MGKEKSAKLRDILDKEVRETIGGSDGRETIKQMEERAKELNKSDVFDIMATSYRRLYHALRYAEFSKEEAMAIVTSQGLGLSTE